jgi:hypothetical protein
MARPSKITNPITKTFRLPGELVGRLEASALLRDVELSDVVREILEAGVSSYEEESQRVRRKRLREAIAAVQADAELRAIFDRQKGRPRASIPLNAGIDRARLATLLDALAASKELEEAGQEDEIHPLLRALEAQLQGRLGNLNELVNSGLLVVREENGQILFEPDERLYESVIVNKDPGSQAEEEFFYLVKERLVRKAGSHRGVEIYRWAGGR